MALSTASTRPRERLRDALAHEIAVKGLAATTVSDIVAGARVSKRTFYEQYADKEECFIDLVGAAATSLLEILAEAAAPVGTTDERIARGARAYVEAIAGAPALARILLIDIESAGDRARAERRRILGAFAALLERLADDAAAAGEDVRPLPSGVALVLVGGVNELMVNAMEESGAVDIDRLSATVVDVAKRVLLPGA